jgi:predicted DNA-binding transcriptional regulator AlpA
MIRNRPSALNIVKGKEELLFNNQIMEAKSIWHIDDLMAFTGLAKQTIYNKVSLGEIPCRKRWGKLYFVPDEILNLIEEGE